MAGFPYFPHTDADVQSMLDRIGVKKVEDLYADVPKEFIKKGVLVGLSLYAGDKVKNDK